MSPAESAAAPDVFCLATPHGRSAIATVFVQGPEIAEKLDRLFQPACGRPFSRCRGQTLIYGTWNSPQNCPESNQQIHKDHVPPTSITCPGEDLVLRWRDSQTVEIHCHGGLSASQSIMNSLRQNDFAPVNQNEFARRMHRNVWSAQVQLAIARALTARTSKILLRQYTLLPNAIETIGRQILAQQAAAAMVAIQHILLHWRFGNHLTIPWSVVLCGWPNVGKSSLINRLLGYERAIVHAKPGTTRDVLGQLTVFDGWPVEIKDTAGLRLTGDQLERQGMARAKEQISQADVVIAIFDGSTAWTDDDTLLLQQMGPHLVVHNKSDLGTAGDPDNRPAGLGTSALTGSGIGQLIDTIGQALVPQLPAHDQALPLCREQIDCLTGALASLERGQQSAAITCLQQMSGLDFQVLTDQARS